MIGDVTLAKGIVVVIITAEDQQIEPSIVADYLEDGYEIVKDEREQETTDNLGGHQNPHEY